MVEETAEAGPSGAAASGGEGDARVAAVVSGFTASLEPAEAEATGAAPGDGGGDAGPGEGGGGALPEARGRGARELRGSGAAFRERELRPLPAVSRRVRRKHTAEEPQPAVSWRLVKQALSH